MLWQSFCFGADVFCHACPSFVMDRKLRLIRHKSCIHGSCICRGLSTSWSPCPLVGGLERREQTFLGRASKQVCAFLCLDTRQVVALRHGGTVQFSIATCKSRPCPAGPKRGTLSGPAGGSPHTPTRPRPGRPAHADQPLARGAHVASPAPCHRHLFSVLPSPSPLRPVRPLAACASLPPSSLRAAFSHVPAFPAPLPPLSLSPRPPPRRRLRATTASALAAVLGGPCAPNEQVSRLWISRDLNLDHYLIDFEEPDKSYAAFPG
jgi:hypothetical protein